jgi:hypothetical protein
MSKILAWIKANFTKREVQIMDLKLAYHLPEVPFWNKIYQGELRSPVTFVVTVVILLQLLLPSTLALNWQREIVYAELITAISLFMLNPGRIKVHKRHRFLHSIGLNLLLTAVNIMLTVNLIEALLTGRVFQASSLLTSSAIIWFSNVVIFSLWYWEFDRGGPGARAEARDPYPDFLFPQMTDERYVREGWSPNYFDYLYTSFTNSIAFSPTDTLPLSRWAKFLMMIEALISSVVVILAISRSINILG